MLACAAYWIFEREHAIRLVTSLLPRPRRKVVRDTWDLIDAKLGAYVRGQALLITLVATTLSLIFWAIGLPFWLLVGVFAGFVEIVPVIGPLTAGAVAVGVGLTESIQLGVAAGVIVLVVRLAGGLPRDPEGARRGGRALPAARPRVGDRDGDPVRRRSRCCSPFRWPPCWRRSST